MIKSIELDKNEESQVGIKLALVGHSEQFFLYELSIWSKYFRIENWSMEGTSVCINGALKDQKAKIIPCEGYEFFLFNYWDSGFRFVIKKIA